MRLGPTLGWVILYAISLLFVIAALASLFPKVKMLVLFEKLAVHPETPAIHQEMCTKPGCRNFRQHVAEERAGLLRDSGMLIGLGVMAMACTVFAAVQA